MKKVLTHYHYIILAIIFALAFFLRFYKLDSIPNGLYQDETAIGYNAYSILTTGKDEYGKTLPLYFKSFGDEKLPVYIYLTTVSERMFGITPFAVRFPSALFGFLTVVIFYFFVKQLTKEKNLALISTLLLAINPWSLDYNRATFEVSVCLFLFVCGGYLLQRAFESKKFGLFLLGTVLFIVCLYSYNLTRLLAPVLFVLFLFLNSKKLKGISKLEYVVTALLSLFLLIPFVTTIFSTGGASSASGTFIFSSNAVKAPLLEFRSYFIYYPLFSKIFLNTWILLLWQYCNNIVVYFSTPFMFVTGSSHGNHGIGNAGQFYLFEFPLIVAGIIVMLKQKLRGRTLLIAWAIATILVASLTRDIPQATRSIFLVVPLEIFSAVGLMWFVALIFGIRNKIFSGLTLIVAIVFALYSILFYFSSYYMRFPVLYAKQWNEEDRPLVAYVSKNINNYDKILIDTKSGFIYTSYLFYAKYNPYQFYSSVRRLPDDNEGFSIVQSFGKIEFRDIDWNKDYNTPNQLIITSNNYKPNEIPIEKTFYYPARPVVQSVSEVINIFPVQDIAYEVIKTK